MNYYLAIDIGASSGRHIVGYKDESNQLHCEEVYRFKNAPTLVNEHLTWDIDYLLKEVKSGIKLALEKYHEIKSMSIDTWGVDYVLIDENDNEILPCYCYRDDRTKGIINEVHKLISFENLYSITGSQFQPFNTIYQLYADKLSGRLNNAKHFLYIPEYLMFKLTGKKVFEYTNASTSGMLDCLENGYSREIVEKLEFGKHLFKPLSKPKTIVGSFTEAVIKEVGKSIEVVLCPTHDTAAAVEGIPMVSNNPYISSGTWSLLGIKVDKVINSCEAMQANYSNEYGPNYIRFQKNIMGLWIIQNLSKQFNLDFVSMTELAKTSNYKQIYDVNDEVFLANNDVRQAIINWYFKRNMILPTNSADIINATYHSLAYSYKEAINELENITGEKYDCIYIVGGGAKNNYLNELTQKYTKKKVVALPIEATAIGNLLTQMEVYNER